MARVEIINSLYKEILKRFKKESYKIVLIMKSLEENPNKGKNIGNVGEYLIKELKYKNFRFYFITDGHNYKFIDKEMLTDTLLKFVRMSNKKYQQKTIDEIKNILLTIGINGF